MKLLIVIVNYRTSGLTVDCLRSLESQVVAIPDARVVVVDNASGDGSAELIESRIASEGWGAWANVLRSTRNGGFAYGNNLAIRSVVESNSSPEFVHLLNPDTVVQPGAVQKLLEFLETNPAAGIAGSSLESPDGGIHPNAYRFYSILSEFEEAVSIRLVSKLLRNWSIVQPLSGGNQPVDWVCGASMMIRRDVFETAGFFDEDYFLYYEEADFCLQANRAGWECWYVPESRVVHVLSAATGVLSGSKRRPRYWFESRRHYLRKNHGSLYTLVANLVWVAGFVLWKTRRVLQRRPPSDPPHMLSDFLRFSFFARKPQLPAGSDP